MGDRSLSVVVCRCKYMYFEGIWEWGAEEYIWAAVGGMSEGLEGTVQLLASCYLTRLWNVCRLVKSKRMRRSEHVACIGGERNACRVLVGKAEGNSPLGRRRHRWEVNIAMNLQQVVELVCLSQNMSKWRSVVNTVTKCGEFLDELRNC